MKRNNWTDSYCYYVSIIDGDRKALVAGPFRHHREALEMVDRAMVEGGKLDPKSHFYSWGTTKAPNGYHEGCLNNALNV